MSWQNAGLNRLFAYLRTFLERRSTDLFFAAHPPFTQSHKQIQHPNPKQQFIMSSEILQGWLISWAKHEDAKNTLGLWDFESWRLGGK
jgi:hypothetical protein